MCNRSLKRSMGKQWPNTAPWKEGEGGHGGSAWAYWPGSWKTGRQQRWNKTEGQEDTAGTSSSYRQFPAYKQMDTSVNRDKATDKGENAQGGDNLMQHSEETFVKLMQKCLNNSRRIDSKIRKNLGDRDDRQKKWMEFQERLKASFVEQRQQFLADTKKADQELEELKIQKQTTLKQIQDLVSNKDKPVKAVIQAATPSDEDVQAWNELMAHAPTRQDEAQHMEVEDDVVLRQALLAASNPETFMSMTFAESEQAETAQSSNASLQGGLSVNAPVPATAGAGLLLTPPRQPSAAPPRTPPRPAQPVRRLPKVAGAGRENVAGLNVEYHTIGNPLLKDPYMQSPVSGPGLPSTGTPKGLTPTFGPIRTPQARELQRLSPKMNGGHVSDGVNKIPQCEIQTTRRVESEPYDLRQQKQIGIIDDDGDPTIGAAGNPVVDLLGME